MAKSSDHGAHGPLKSLDKGTCLGARSSDFTRPARDDQASIDHALASRRAYIDHALASRRAYIEDGVASIGCVNSVSAAALIPSRRFVIPSRRFVRQCIPSIGCVNSFRQSVASTHSVNSVASTHSVNSVASTLRAHCATRPTVGLVSLMPAVGLVLMMRVCHAPFAVGLFHCAIARPARRQRGAQVEGMRDVQAKRHPCSDCIPSGKV